MTAWSNAYVGLPFRDHGRDRYGVDCWGLACLVYRETFGIELPGYEGYGTADERAEIAALVTGAVGSPLWKPVQDPAPYDIVVFRRGHLSSHVGLVVVPGAMLHVAAGDSAKVEDFRSGRWRHRLSGTFRWQVML